MSEEPTDKTKLAISITIPVELRIKMIELGISPADVARRALMSAVSKRNQRARNQNKKLQLGVVRRLDPTIKNDGLVKPAGSDDLDG